MYLVGLKLNKMINTRTTKQLTNQRNEIVKRLANVDKLKSKEAFAREGLENNIDKEIERLKRDNAMWRRVINWLISIASFLVGYIVIK